MESCRTVVNVDTRGEGDIVDVTPLLEEALTSSKFSEGLLCAFVPHSTAALFTIEFEPGLERDMKDALERCFPKGLDYEHHRRWGDGNGHSHIRSSFLGPSITVPFHRGKMDRGTWQQIVLMELDVRARRRELIIQIIGGKS
jgi:secondary thiamine-phosphate synthase enzyme